MKEIVLKKREINVQEFVKRSALETDCSTLITEPCILKNEAGEVIAIYDRLPSEVEALREGLKHVKYQTTERTGGLKTVSRIFGFMPRVTLRSDFCRMANLAQEMPEVNALLMKWGGEAEKRYAEYAPARFKNHESLLEKVLETYRLPKMVFTSGIINKNNPLKYHFDSGNFEGVFSCMIGLKEGIAGGYLAFPEYDVMLEIADRTVSLFDGQEVLHGVTPIIKTRDDATRFTVVYYSLKQMWNCKPLDEELARIRKLKTMRELKRAGRIKPAV